MSALHILIAPLNDNAIKAIPVDGPSENHQPLQEGMWYAS